MNEATRHSLIGRLHDWRDHARWQEFFETYWRLIFSVARRAGLTEPEAQDVVQETILAVAKNIAGYDRTAGRFKPWLLQMTRWRIADQLRKRLPLAPSATAEADSHRQTATLDRFPSPEAEWTRVWEEEWQQQTLQAALARVKAQVKPAHYQVFDCLIRKHWPVKKVATELGLNVAQVYLIKHRLGLLLRKELQGVEAGQSLREA